MADGIERVTDMADPNRCKGVARGSQCTMKALPNTEYCPMHGGRIQENSNNRKEIHNLKLTKWAARLSQMANSSSIFSLRDEIGVMRITLEELLNKCSDANELLIYEPNICRLTMNIGKLVKDFHSIEQNMGQLLSKQALMDFAGQVVDIICQKIDDEALRKEIAGEIITIACEAGNESSDDDGEEDQQ